MSLLKDGQQAILNLEICDPGVNMVEGARSSLPRGVSDFLEIVFRELQEFLGLGPGRRLAGPLGFQDQAVREIVARFGLEVSCPVGR